MVYAVGDVHGRRDLLDPLLVKILEDAQSAEGRPRPLIVFLGDYVDRGTDSRGVVERVIRFAASGLAEVRMLKGNHEEQLLLFLKDPRAGGPWCAFGGAETLRSYGVSPPGTRGDMDQWEDTRQKFLRALPTAHLEFFNALEVAVICGDYLFVHAGVRPGVPLEAQSERDLLWIRDDFLSSERAFEKVVVHGHTPEPEPFLGRHRIGVDTGAYATSILTAVRLFETQRATLQSRISDAGLIFDVMRATEHPEKPSVP